MEENSASGIPEPADEFRISDLDTLKVLSDPLRLQLVEQLLEGPRTVKQLAQEIGTAPTKLYYHMNLLEERGLIRVVSTRVVSGIIEKQYHISAYSYPIDKALLSVAGPTLLQGLPQVVQATLEHTAHDLNRSFQEDLIDLGDKTFESLNFVGQRVFAQMTRKQAHEFATRLLALLSEFDHTYTPHGDPGRPEEDVRVYGVTIVFYPSHLRSLPQPKKKETGNNE